MGLESVTYINDLVATWPLGTDQVRQGDDHIRNVKKAVKNTFPNITGPVTKTQAELNALPSNWVAVLAELVEHLVPVGAIFAWSGTIAAIPAGYHVCDGAGGTPDLRSRFIFGTASEGLVGTTGGATTALSAVGGVHDHGGDTGSTVLTAATMPQHRHTLLVSNSTDTTLCDAFGTNTNQAVAGNTDATRAYRDANGLAEPLMTNTGGGGGHTHTIASDPGHQHAVSILPPYYTLAYIMKTTAYVAP